MLFWLLNVLFGHVKRPYYTHELSREEKEFVERHWPSK